MLFVVPKVHQVTTLNGCHWDAGHQGHDLTLSLTAGALLVAWDGQPDMTSHQKLHTMSTAQGWPAQGPSTPHHGYHSPWISYMLTLPA